MDPARIGIWGGSYGGYHTALALARDSATFRAGVDLHGVHDWSRTLAEEAKPADRYEQGDWDAALKTAFESSPVASVAGWRSPVLLIHGDDDRNVRFNQTIDLARRLDAAGGAVRGAGAPERDPRLPAPRGLAARRHGDGAVLRARAGAVTAAGRLGERRVEGPSRGCPVGA